MHDQEGWSLTELLAVLMIVGLCVAVGVPSTARVRAGSRAAAGARFMAVSFHDLRWQAVVRRVHRGLYFQEDEGGWRWHVVEDGNGNGLRTAEIRDGTDRTLSGPHRLQEIVPGVRPGFLHEQSVPAIPPRRGSYSAGDDPVRFGRSDIISFSPLGSSSSGTLYLTDGRWAQYGVVLFGPSTRVRVWRYDPDTGSWSL
jgi:Tfp pilus assembly protein FimT